MTQSGSHIGVTEVITGFGCSFQFFLVVGFVRIRDLREQGTKHNTSKFVGGNVGTSSFSARLFADDLVQRVQRVFAVAIGALPEEPGHGQSPRKNEGNKKSALGILSAFQSFVFG